MRIGGRLHLSPDRVETGSPCGHDDLSLIQKAAVEMISSAAFAFVCFVCADA